MAPSDPGAVAAAYRAWIADLGPLSPRQATIAARMLVLAGQLDRARDEPPGSWPASLSRELRQLAGDIRDAGAAAPAQPSIVDGEDELAKLRRRNAKAAGGG